MTPIYFDNAATTALDPRVLESMMPYLSGYYGNASAFHGPGRTARLAVEMSRKKIAAMLGCEPACIIFTSGGTESANTAIRSAVRTHRLSTVITSRTEHAAVLQTAKNLHHRGQVALQYVALKETGDNDLLDLDRQLEQLHGGILVSLMHANNETGMLMNLENAGEICKFHKAIFFSDTVQTVGHYPLNLSNLPVDMICASAHKFHGPKGVGFLYIRKGLHLQPFLTGGSHEFGFRAGTENVAGIVGLARALAISMEEFAEQGDRIRKLNQRLATGLRALGASINSNTGGHGLYTILNARFPKNESTVNMILQLDIAGVAASAGSACSAGRRSSHVMEALGLGDDVNIRFSFSKYNTQEEVDYVVDILNTILSEENSPVEAGNIVP